MSQRHAVWEAWSTMHGIVERVARRRYVSVAESSVMRSHVSERGWRAAPRADMRRMMVSGEKKGMSVRIRMPRSVSSSVRARRRAKEKRRDVEALPRVTASMRDISLETEPAGEQTEKARLVTKESATEATQAKMMRLRADEDSEDDAPKEDNGGKDSVEGGDGEEDSDREEGEEQESGGGIGESMRSWRAGKRLKR